MATPIIDMAILGLIAINVVLTILLLLIYLKNHRAVKSKFTWGLLVFAGAFLLENLLNLFFYGMILTQEVYGFTTFQLSVNFLEMIALLILLYVTWK